MASADNRQPYSVSKAEKLSNYSRPLQDTAEIYSTANDARINVVFAGHHATEIVGVKALSLVIGREFNIETLFVDIPTKL
jgi:hypothetical protein